MSILIDHKVWKPKRPEHPDFEQALRLDEAVLCADCNVLRHIRRVTCPSCGSTSAHSISRWLDRTGDAA